MRGKSTTVKILVISHRLIKLCKGCVAGKQKNIIINKRFSSFGANFCKASLLRNYVCLYIGGIHRYQTDEPITEGVGG